MWHRLTISQDADKVTTASSGIYSESLHGHENPEGFSHLLLGGKRTELTLPPFSVWQVVAESL